MREYLISVTSYLPGKEPAKTIGTVFLNKEFGIVQIEASDGMSWSGHETMAEAIRHLQDHHDAAVAARSGAK